MDENKKAAQKKKVTHFITMAVLVILFLAFIFPFIMVIINAFKTKGDITADPLALIGSHGFILTNFTYAIYGYSVPGTYDSSGILIRRYLWCAEQQNHPDSYAHRILTFYGNLHVPRSYSYQHSFGTGRSSTY